MSPFVMEMKFVSCAIGAEFLYVIYLNGMLHTVKPFVY